MKIDLIMKIAKRGIIKQSDQFPFPLRSYLTVLSKPRNLRTPQMYSDRVLTKSMYSSSAQQPEKTGFIGWYLRMLDFRPILTKAVSSSLIYAAADVTSQMITMPASGSIDFLRMTRIASFGFLILGLQGENGHEIIARLKRDLFPTLVSGLIYWPLCDFLTFKLIPVQLQPLINSSFAYLWSIYLTYMAGLEKVE